MKIVIFNLLVLLSFGSLWAQGLDAAEILKKSATVYRTATSISVDFKGKIHYTLTGERTSYDAKLILGKKDRFILEMSDRQYISNGVDLWEYMIPEQQVLQKSLLDMDGRFHPSGVLFQYLQCKALSIEKVKKDGDDYYHLVLDPKGKIKTLKALEVWLNPKTLAPAFMKTIDVSDAHMEYTITEFKRNFPLDNNRFEFVAPAGVEMMDPL